MNDMLFVCCTCYSRTDPKAIRVRIVKKIDSLETNPTPQGVTLLKGKDREAYRVRVGDHRILYEIKKDILTILVIKIGHRREVYRGF